MIFFRLTVAAIFIAALLLTSPHGQTSMLPSSPAPSPQPSPSPTPKKETWGQWILRITGLSSSSANQKGDDYEGTGYIYLADRMQDDEKHPLTDDDGYRWPLFMPCEQSIIAMKGDSLVKVSLSSREKQTLYPAIKNIVKLVGFDRENNENVVVLLAEQDENAPVGLLSLKTGQITRLPYDKNSAADQLLLIQAQGPVRTFGELTVSTRALIKDLTPGKTSKWIDVFLQESPGAPVNFSNCEGIDCGQPTVSPEARYVAYIRAKK